jgi:GAF domain-containing protein
MPWEGFKRWRAAADISSIGLMALDECLALHRTKFGNVQLVNWERRELPMLVHRGFGKSFLSSFQTVKLADATACARAAYQRGPIAIADVRHDPAFEPYLPAAEQAGFRSVLSMPMISGRGALVGILSVHFASPHEVSKLDLRETATVAQRGADLLIRGLAKLGPQTDVGALHLR